MQASRQVVLVTGAAGDIGAAIARAFLGRGAAVILTDISDETLDRRERSLRDKGMTASIACDLADAEATAELAASALRLHGRVDCLVNNAAIQPDGDLYDCAPDEFERAFAVNVRAPYLLSRGLAPAMRDAGGGSIVNIASIHATAPGPRRLAYATTKTALLGMTRALAVDLGRDRIRVNALSPGATMTSQLRAAWEKRQAVHGVDIFAHAARQHPSGALVEPEDVAAATVYLAAAQSVTGVELRVDGGLMAALRLLPG